VTGLLIFFENAPPGLQKSDDFWCRASHCFAMLRPGFEPGSRPCSGIFFYVPREGRMIGRTTLAERMNLICCYHFNAYEFFLSSQNIARFAAHVLGFTNFAKQNWIMPKINNVDFWMSSRFSLKISLCLVMK